MLDKIKYLCKNIVREEWSGVLFYTVDGTIKKPQEMKIILQDILPLDKGTAAWTEYELDSRFIDFIQADLDVRMDWKVGHIHSHNVMRVFFSGADQDELNDNSPLHDYYLSMIVNNYMEMIAKIAFTGDIKHTAKKVPYYSNDEEGKRYVSSIVDLTHNQTVLFTYDCDIQFPEQLVININDEFEYYFLEIMKPKKVYVPPTLALPAVHKPVIQLKPNEKKIVDNIGYKPKEEELITPRHKKIHSIVEKLPFTEYEDLTVVEPIERFIAEVMKFSNPLEDGENLEDVLSTLEDLKLDSYQIAQTALQYFPVLYAKHFEDATDEEFIIDTELAIDYLYDFIAQFPFVNITVEALKQMVKDFEENVTATV